MQSVNSWMAPLVLSYGSGGSWLTTTSRPVPWLEEGGTCIGSAFRITEDDIENELSLVWMREMLDRGYAPLGGRVQ